MYNADRLFKNRKQRAGYSLIRPRIHLLQFGVAQILFANAENSHFSWKTSYRTEIFSVSRNFSLRPCIGMLKLCLMYKSTDYKHDNGKLLVVGVGRFD